MMPMQQAAEPRADVMMPVGLLSISAEPLSGYSAPRDRAGIFAISDGRALDAGASASLALSILALEPLPAKAARAANRRRSPPKARADWSTADDQIASLLAAASTGDSLSFAKLHRATRSRLLNLIGRIERDSNQAEEILQEVYLSIWRRGDQFDGARGSAMQWLAGIARNRAIAHLRARACRPKSARFTRRHDDPYEGLASGRPGPLEQAIRSDDARSVCRCLRMLGAQQREIVVLSFWQGLTHEEISETTGRPLGTVKSWLRRSLLAMRETLANPAPLGSPS